MRFRMMSAVAAAVLTGATALPALAQAAFAPPAAQAGTPEAWSRLAAGADPIDEAYRDRFARCDAADSQDPQAFEGRRGCSDDPNRVAALVRLEGGPVAFVSKLAVDLDGSPLACSLDRGRSDQCPTTLMLPSDDGLLSPVDADRVPYVVIPAAGPAEHRGEFSRLTGVHVGDFGVVMWRGRVVPVIVADTGPYPKLGEGSLALHRALGHDQCGQRDAEGVCRGGSDAMSSIDGEVVTVLFPGSARDDLAPDTLAETVRTEGARLWEAYRRERAQDPS